MPMYKQELVDYEPKRDILSPEKKLEILNEILERLSRLFYGSGRAGDQQLINGAQTPLTRLRDDLESEVSHRRPRPKLEL